MAKTLKRILFVSAEAAPLAKAGGLADVVGSLPKALMKQQGLDVRIVLPFYRAIERKRYRVRKRAERFSVSFDGIRHVVRLFETTLPGSRVPVYLLDHPHYEGAGDIYYQDVTNTKEQQQLQVERFLFFSRCIPELLATLRWSPDILHCHDWHAASAAFLTRLFGAQDGHAPASVYTIHNLPLQGSIFLPRFRELLGLSRSSLSLPANTIQNNTVNLTALGLATADILTTVSPQYAKEILLPSYGAGLDHLIRKRRDRLTGILNGIDVDVFDPSHDPAIIPFTATNLDRREQNTKQLQKQLRLEGRRPILGLVSRLTSQKGIALVCRILPRLVQLGCSAAILGSGEPELETSLRVIAKQYPGRVSVTIGFDPVLAQRIYAGSDAFLMPSLFEPCGLGQMIAMRYGSIPIVRETGGLKDSVRGGPQRTGFLFQKPSAAAFQRACLDALALFRDKKRWRALQRRAMARDFSWSRSSRFYLRAYHAALNNAHDQT